MNKTNLISGIGCSLVAAGSTAGAIILAVRLKKIHQNEWMRSIAKVHVDEKEDVANELIIGGFIGLSASNALNYTIKAINAFKNLK